MDALILAAGEGSRLLPLTRTKPKPLFPILNRSLLQFTFDYLNRFSIQRVILNTHHLSGQIEKFVQIEKENRSFEIQTRFEPTILETGGGIGNTRDFWSSYPFVVINGDILTDIDLHQAVGFHQSHKGPVTLILHDYPEFNQILVDGQGRIQDFQQEKGHGLAFTGIHLLEKKIFDFLPPSGAFEIIPIYMRMIREGIPVRAFISRGHYWRDIGTPRSYLKVHEELLPIVMNPEDQTNITKFEHKSPLIPLFQRGTLSIPSINSPPLYQRVGGGDLYSPRGPDRKRGGILRLGLHRKRMSFKKGMPNSKFCALGGCCGGNRSVCFRIDHWAGGSSQT